MLSDLSKGLDRNFLVAHYLPALVLLMLSFALLVNQGVLRGGRLADLAGAATDNSVIAITGAAIAIWLVAAVFTAFNAGIMSLMACDFTQQRWLPLPEHPPTKSGGEPLEVPPPPLRDGAFEWVGRLVASVGRLDARLGRRCREHRYLTGVWDHVDRELERTDLDEETREQLKSWRRRAAMKLAVDYPSDPACVLPSRFGCIVTAFTQYPLDAYGLAGSAGWSRLRSVMSEESRAQVDTAKANVDFIVNLCVVWSLTAAAIFGLLLWPVGARLFAAEVQPAYEWQAIGWFRWDYALAFVIALGLVGSLTWLSHGAARRWGSVVIAAYDVHLRELSDSLTDAARPGESPRQAWGRLSHRWIFRPEYREQNEAAPEAPLAELDADGALGPSENAAMGHS